MQSGRDAWGHRARHGMGKTARNSPTGKQALPQERLQGILNQYLAVGCHKYTMAWFDSNYNPNLNSVILLTK